MHVTFLFAFSSRYAKTRTSNFHNVVWQHTKGIVGSSVWILLQIYFFPTLKKFWKSVRSWRSYRHEFS